MYKNDHEIYQKFPLQGLLNYTKVGIFGMQINHLATLQQRLPPSRPESSKPLNFFAQVAIFYILGRGLLIFAIDLKYYYSILLIVPTCNNYCNLTKCRSAVALKKFHF
jgi:hypothetical protein